VGEEDRQVVREVMGTVAAELDQTARMDDRRAREALENAGLQYVTVEAADVASWRRTVETIYPALRRRPDIDAELLDRLLAILAEYRSSHRPTSG
jgi:TRAP-type C4-dicarboxylate transport system substrate-binding protein